VCLFSGQFFQEKFSRRSFPGEVFQERFSRRSFPGEVFQEKVFQEKFSRKRFSGRKFSGDVLWVGFSEEAVRVSVAGLYGRPEERICAYNNIGMAGRGPARVVSLAFLCIRRSD
jgi:hypothetical protein